MSDEDFKISIKKYFVPAERNISFPQTFTSQFDVSKRHGQG